MASPEQEPLERQPLLPRLSVRLLIGVLTLAACVAWVGRAAAAGQPWAIAVCAVLAMFLACLVAYAVVFLIGWLPARVIWGDRSELAPSDPSLPPQLVAPPRDVAQ